MDYAFDVFSSNKKIIPHNGRNIGVYEDYKLMCNRCESYYIIKICKHNYKEFCNYVPFKMLCDKEIPNMLTDIFNTFFAEIWDIKNKYNKNIYIHDYKCYDIDDINENDENCYYLMYIECQC